MASNKLLEPTCEAARGSAAAFGWKAGGVKMMHRGIWTLILVALLAFPALAESPLTAQGEIRDVEIEGAVVTFKMSGGVILRRMNAPENAALKSGHTWFPVDILVRVRFPSANTGTTSDPTSTAMATYNHLRNLLIGDDSDEVQFSVDDPSLTFSNDGVLRRVEGAGLHARKVGLPNMVE